MPILPMSVDSSFDLVLWNMTENVDLLLEGIELNRLQRDRYSSMNTYKRKLEYLSVFQLLKHKNLDSLIYYDINNKPLLSDGRFISISHSDKYSALVTSEKKIGIDIEKKRYKILDIAPKFCSDLDLKALGEVYDQIMTKTMIWSIKEAVFKMNYKKGVNFKNDIEIKNIDLNSNSGLVVIEKDFKKIEIKYFYRQVGDYMLVVTIEK